MATVLSMHCPGGRAPAPPDRAAPPALARSASAAGRLRLALLRLLRRRAALRELCSLDDRLLRDIGVRRDGVDDFVAASLRAWSEHAVLPSTRHRPGSDPGPAPSRPVIPAF